MDLGLSLSGASVQFGARKGSSALPGASSAAPVGLRLVRELKRARQPSKPPPRDFASSEPMGGALLPAIQEASQPRVSSAQQPGSRRAHSSSRRERRRTDVPVDADLPAANMDAPPVVRAPDERVREFVPRSRPAAGAPPALPPGRESDNMDEEAALPRTNTSELLSTGAKVEREVAALVRRGEATVDTCAGAAPPCPQSPRRDEAPASEAILPAAAPQAALPPAAAPPTEPALPAEDIGKETKRGDTPSETASTRASDGTKADPTLLVESDDEPLPQPKKKKKKKKNKKKKKEKERKASKGSIVPAEEAAPKPKRPRVPAVPEHLRAKPKSPEEELAHEPPPRRPSVPRVPAELRKPVELPPLAPPERKPAVERARSEPRDGDELGLGLTGAALKPRKRTESEKPRPRPDPKDDLPVSNAYLTFAYMRAEGKRKVFFENRNEVQRFLQELDETVCKPLQKTFCMRCSFLAEHHCQAKKPGVTVRDPLLLRKKVGPGEGDVIEEMRYTSTIRLRLRKKDSATELLDRRTVLCVLLHEMAHLRHMNHGKKFMLVLRDLFSRAAELGLISPETSKSRNEIPSPWAWENEIQSRAGGVSDEQLLRLFAIQRKVDKAKKRKLQGDDIAESDEDEIIVKKVKVKEEVSEDMEPSPPPHENPSLGAPAELSLRTPRVLPAGGGTETRPIQGEALADVEPISPSDPPRRQPVLPPLEQNGEN